ncbi:MAG TPA: phosphoribosyltransferase family protein [Nitrososphaeraceae archaeon]|nr:phosphoribosyltransferase family protein [Nitrososphaeraceae archaeon]
MILNSISNKFQLKYRDREAAGNILSESLKTIIKKDERKNTIVVGIPRGGIIIADVIARKLCCKFDIVMPRKIRAPYNEELAIGAIMGDGTTYINNTIVKDLQISTKYIEDEKFRQLEEIKRRLSLYCFSNSFTKHNNNFSNKTIILVDDGAATGATIIAAIRWIRLNKNPYRFIVAVPIVPKNTLNLMKREDINCIEVITSPNFNFKSVEQYYKNFNQVTDNQVINILAKYKNDNLNL